MYHWDTVDSFLTWRGKLPCELCRPFPGHQLVHGEADRAAALQNGSIDIRILHPPSSLKIVLWTTRLTPMHVLLHL